MINACAIQPYVRMCDTSGGTPVLACIGEIPSGLPVVGRRLSMYVACLTANGHMDLCSFELLVRRFRFVVMRKGKRSRVRFLLWLVPLRC